MVRVNTVLATATQEEGEGGKDLGPTYAKKDGPGDPVRPGPFDLVPRKCLHGPLGTMQTFFRPTAGDHRKVQ